MHKHPSRYDLKNPGNAAVLKILTSLGEIIDEIYFRAICRTFAELVVIRRVYP